MKAPKKPIPPPMRAVLSVTPTRIELIAKDGARIIHIARRDIDQADRDEAIQHLMGHRWTREQAAHDIATCAYLTKRDGRYVSHTHGASFDEMVVWALRWLRHFDQQAAAQEIAAE